MEKPRTLDFYTGSGDDERFEEAKYNGAMRKYQAFTEAVHELVEEFIRSELMGYQDFKKTYQELKKGR